MNLFVKTEVFHTERAARPSLKATFWRGLVCRRPDREVVLRCPHAHRSSMAAHKCAVRLMNDDRARANTSS